MGTGCSQKIRYRTREDAEAAARLTPTHRNNLRPYKCPECWGWHIGHKRPYVPREDSPSSPKPKKARNMKPRRETMKQVAGQDRHLKAIAEEEE